MVYTKSMGFKKAVLFLSLFTFTFSFFTFRCFGQDTIVFKNGKKIVGRVISAGKTKVIYTVPPDTIQKSVSIWRLNYVKYPGGTKLDYSQYSEKKHYSNGDVTSLYFSIDGGYTVPSVSYKDAIVGNEFNIKGTFYVNKHIGITASAGMDLNGTGLNYISNNYLGGFYIFRQYLAGVSYRTGGAVGFPFVDFIGMFGLCNSSNPVSELGNGNKGITVNTPGTGTGPGFYVGIAFSNSANHVCSMTFGIGCFGAVMNYSGNTSSFSKYDPYTTSTSTTVTNPSLKMTLLLPEMYLGINFRAKKAGR